MKFSRLTYIAFFVAIILRLVVLFSSRPFVFGGDSYSYIALSREISGNLYLIPYSNQIHYPGSEFIFPPAVPYFLSIFVPVMSTFDLLAILTFMDILLGSIPVFLISSITSRLGGKNPGIISGFIYGTLPAFIYLDTWGDVAQVLGIVVILILVLLLLDVLDNPGSRRYTFFAFLALVFLAFSHDLSFFFSLFFIFISIIVIAALNAIKRQQIFSIQPVLVILISGGIVGSTWYILHPAWISFILEGFLSSSTHSTVTAYGLASSISPLFAVPYGYNILAFLFFALLFVSWIYTHFGRWSNEKIILDALMLASLIPAVVFLSNPVLFSRFLYFASLGYSIAGSILLADILAYRRKGASLKLKRFQFVAKVVVILIIAMYLSLSVTINSSSHVYYVSGGGPGNTFDENVMLSDWIGSHDSNGAVAAPQQIGFMIMAFANVPVLVSENSTLLTQKVEVSESMAAGELISLTGNITLVKELSTEYSVQYVVTNQTAHPDIYKPVFSNSFYTVYRITI
ncbi:MAG: hypothetical protein M1327_00690 [Candidatus Thermoplasmatota archaeon]|nr:hypothetical protein [Candidatus Thermoplasmatota archaeon]